MGVLSAILIAATAEARPTLTYSILGDPGPWPGLMSLAGVFPSTPSLPGDVMIVRAGAKADLAILDVARRGTLVVLEGESPVANSAGFRANGQRVTARNAVDRRDSRLAIIWETPVEIPRIDLPKDARIFVEERWTGAPLMAGIRFGEGAVLWMATDPGSTGSERFPYLLQALEDLGLRPAFRSHGVWAFFDSSYRLRVDPDFMAAKWRRAGIEALHVAAWHFYDLDPARDEYLKRLIEACHRHAILVYAWLELPHVSEKFWADHPEWREKTALMQDAHLDWRRLMNLANPDCFKAVSAGVRALLNRYDWDGINLAELYFESLEGVSNPSRFTPLNMDVRKGFEAAHGFDPLLLFQAHADPASAGMRKFLDYRADLAGKLQSAWLEQLDVIRLSKPHLDLVLTHVDDRFDPRMRDLIGADTSRTLPLLEKHDFTFLIEDPATVWHLGPKRYAEIAGKYAPLTKEPTRLAMDLNIVERYQDVYPTKQQTGVEFFQLVRQASRSFERIALYFESSLSPRDWNWLPVTTALVNRVESAGESLSLDLARPTGVAWRTSAAVDGKLWPAWDGETLWLPRGKHVVEPSSLAPPLRLLDLSAELERAQVKGSAIEIGYRSRSRAIALVDRRPERIQVDGRPADIPILPASPGFALILPRGQHVVSIVAEVTVLGSLR